MKIYFETKKWQRRLISSLFVISLPFLTLQFLRECEINVAVISMILSLIIAIFIIYLSKKSFYKINKPIFIISLLISLFISEIYADYHTNLYSSAEIIGNMSFDYAEFNFNIVSINTLSICISVLASFSLCILLYLLIKHCFPKVRLFLTNLSSFEKMFLTISTIISFVLTIVIYKLLPFFYFWPSVNYDIVFTSDSSILYNGDAFFNINMNENDIRQPLFGLFAMPFAIMAKLLDDIFYFIPNGYAVFLTTIQILLLNVSLIMITKILKLNSEEKVCYFLLFFGCFSSILFSFLIEQYLIGLFYLILFIYLSYQKLDINYSFIPAVGTMATSVVLFPLLSAYKGIKNYTKNIAKCALVAFLLVVVVGQLPQILDLGNTLTRLMSFSGESVSFINKLMQYSIFVKNIFISPCLTTTLLDVGHYNIGLCAANKFSIFGIVILIICIISFILNRKNKIATISFMWVCFSVVLLALLGWGSAENGLILYSLYFSWAFLILIYLFIEKLLNKFKIQKKWIIYLFIFILMVYLNISSYIDIISFGLKYY